MKKYLNLILSILMFILIFIYNWYYIEILDKSFLLIPFINLILLLIYTYLLIINIKKVKQEKNYITIISLWLQLITIVLIAFFPFIEIKTKYELNLYEEERNNVITLVKNNELLADEYGNVKLPKKLKKLSSSGEIVIYQNNVEGQIVSFWINRGLQGDSSIQLIYSSKDELLIKQNKKINTIKNIKKIKNNWYYVITEY